MFGSTPIQFHLVWEKGQKLDDIIQNILNGLAKSSLDHEEDLLNRESKKDK